MQTALIKNDPKFGNAKLMWGAVGTNTLVRLMILSKMPSVWTVEVLGTWNDAYALMAELSKPEYELQGSSEA